MIEVACRNPRVCDYESHLATRRHAGAHDQRCPKAPTQGAQQSSDDLAHQRDQQEARCRTTMPGSVTTSHPLQHRSGRRRTAPSTGRSGPAPSQGVRVGYAPSPMPSLAKKPDGRQPEGGRNTGGQQHGNHDWNDRPCRHEANEHRIARAMPHRKTPRAQAARSYR